jgi:hypothetical protein
MGNGEKKMADAAAKTKLVAPCDYKPLKVCLENNNGDRSKCKKEFDEFQRSCAENKR